MDLHRIEKVIDRLWIEFHKAMDTDDDVKARKIMKRAEELGVIFSADGLQEHYERAVDMYLENKDSLY